MRDPALPCIATKMNPAINETLGSLEEARASLRNLTRTFTSMANWPDANDAQPLLRSIDTRLDAMSNSLASVKADGDKIKKLEEEVLELKIRETRWKNQDQELKQVRDEARRLRLLLNSQPAQPQAQQAPDDPSSDVISTQDPDFQMIQTPSQREREPEDE